MNWPPASDYQDAIQNPAFCFQDTELKAGQPAVNRIGLPRVASGNFASVYQIHNATEKWAVRCFLRQGADQQRYALLSHYLNALTVPGLVEFAYLSPGIRVRAAWYPIVKMDWVDGITLQTFVASHVHDAAKLRSLALQWRGLLDRLRQCRIAHCDLQHGNVLVTPREQLRLVDYDGMYVPALKGQPSHELGHPNYQHPLRSAADYDDNLDNFSALAIYTALRALIAEPALWAEFDTGENLLFSAPDYKSPGESALFQRLRESADPAVRMLADRIAHACAGTPAGTPEFKRLVDSLPPIPDPEQWWQSAAKAGQREQPPTKEPPTKEPQVPPLPREYSAARVVEAAAAEEGPPWWQKRPSTLIGEFRTPEWLAPSTAAAIARARFQSFPHRHILRKSFGCLAGIALSCTVAVMLWIGAVLALQFLYRQLFGGPPPPPRINTGAAAPSGRRSSSPHRTPVAGPR